MRPLPSLFTVVAIAFLAASLVPQTCHADDTLPFQPGERLVFTISWSHFLTAGEGILQVGPKRAYRGREALKFDIIGRTTGFVRKLFRVEDHSQAWFDPQARQSIRTEVKIHENRYRKFKTIDFDRTRQVVRYRIDDRPEEEFAIAPGANGPVSALYVYRTLKPERIAGRHIDIPLFDDKKMYNLRITVLGRERLDLPLGALETIKVEADLKTEALFRRKGKMTLWFSDDSAFVPVQVRTRLPFGSLFATLREFSGVNITAFNQPPPVAIQAAP